MLLLLFPYWLLASEPVAGGLDWSPGEEESAVVSLSLVCRVAGLEEGADSDSEFVYSDSCWAARWVSLCHKVGLITIRPREFLLLFSCIQVRFSFIARLAVALDPSGHPDLSIRVGGSASSCCFMASDKMWSSILLSAELMPLDKSLAATFDAEAPSLREWNTNLRVELEKSSSGIIEQMLQ
ncbi:hypothetical protein SDJN02_02353, partial [Cucurbita argyrosperma subsp. argyrosperma]